MNNDEDLDLEGRIRQKQDELARRTQVMERYAHNIGRDRWHNRGMHDLHTLRVELAALVAQRPAPDTP